VVARGFGNVDADGFRGAVLENAVGEGLLPQLLNQSVGEETPLLHPEIPNRSAPITAPTDHRESEDRMVLRPFIRLTLIVRRRLNWRRSAGNLRTPQVNEFRSHSLFNCVIRPVRPEQATYSDHFDPIVPIARRFLPPGGRMIGGHFRHVNVNLREIDCVDGSNATKFAPEDGSIVPPYRTTYTPARILANQERKRANLTFVYKRTDR
jgi:hypothetical protein